MVERYLRFLLRHRAIILVVIGLITAFFGYRTAMLRIRTNFFELYPPRHEFIKTYRKFRDLFGTANLLTIVMEAKKGNIYNVEFFDKADKITRTLMDTKGVNPFQIMSIVHPSTKGFLVKGYWVDAVSIVLALPKNQADLDEIRLKVLKNPGIRGFLVSEDEKSILILAGLWEEQLDFKDLWNRVQGIKALEDDNITIYASGFPLLYAWLHQYIPTIFFILFITFLCMAILLFFFFGDLKGVGVPLCSALVGAVWGLGMAEVVGLALDPLLLVVPVLLSARCLSHSVQVMERYYNDYRASQNKEESIVSAFRALTIPGTLGILADGFGILTIAVSGIPLMWKLAIYSSFWLISIMVAVFLVSPILLSFASPPHGRVRGFGSEAFYERFARFHLAFIKTNRRQWAVVVTTFVLIVVCGAIGRNLKVGDVSPGRAILKEDHPYNVAYRKLNTSFYGGNQFIIVAEGKKEGAMKEIENLRLLQKFERHLAQKSGAKASVTLTDLVKRVTRLFRENDPNWEVLPYRPRDVGGIAFTLRSGRELNRLYSSDLKTATITLFFTDYSSDVVRRAVAASRDFIRSNPSENMSFHLAGGLLGVLAAVNDEVERSYWLILFSVLATMFVLVTIFYRSLIAPFILLPSLILSQFVSEAIMYFAGIDMNINSLPVAAVGIGIGIDYGIYMLSRIEEEKDWKSRPVEVFDLALRTTGKAVLFTATTMVLSVAFFLFSPVKFTSEMALLLAILMAINMTGGLVIVPALARILKR